MLTALDVQPHPANEEAAVTVLSICKGHVSRTSQVESVQAELRLPHAVPFEFAQQPPRVWSFRDPLAPVFREQVGQTVPELRVAKQYDGFTQRYVILSTLTLCRAMPESRAAAMTSGSIKAVLDQPSQ